MQRRTDVEQLRKEIREAATGLFAAHGYHGTTVQRIADEVGISKQLLLYHFNSKEAVREDVLHGLLEAWNELLPRVLDAVASPGQRGPEVLDELLDHLDQTSELGRVAMMELMVGRAANNDESLVGAVRPWLKVASDFIARRQKDGLFRADADPELLVSSVDLDVVERAREAVPVLGGHSSR